MTHYSSLSSLWVALLLVSMSGYWKTIYTFQISLITLTRYACKYHLYWILINWNILVQMFLVFVKFSVFRGGGPR
jgi:hypothetical protein